MVNQLPTPFPLLIGLGNPGAKYEATLHNLGFMVGDALAQKDASNWKSDSRGPVMMARLGDVTVIKPMTYMNLSGPAVRAWMDWLKVTPQDLLVICDDVYLPLGQVRLRPGGGDGGHNGLASITQALGTAEYARLRCGCGPAPENVPLEDFVLSAFAPKDQAARDELVARGVAAIECCQHSGLALAMNQFNAPLSL